MLLLTRSGWCFFSLFLSTVSADLRPRPLFLFGGGRVHAAESKFWDHQEAGVSKPTGSGSLHVSLCKGQFPGDLWPWDTLLHPLWRLTFIFWFFHNNWFFLFWAETFLFLHTDHQQSSFTVCSDHIQGLPHSPEQGERGECLLEGYMSWWQTDNESIELILFMTLRNCCRHKVVQSYKTKGHVI